MIDETKIEELIQQCPLEESVRGIATRISYEIREDWAGDEAVYVYIHVKASNNRSESDTKKLNDYVNCVNAKMLDGGFLIHTRFVKSPEVKSRKRAARKQLETA
jgi:hypothetical protein